MIEMKTILIVLLILLTVVTASALGDKYAVEFIDTDQDHRDNVTKKITHTPIGINDEVFGVTNE